MLYIELDFIMKQCIVLIFKGNSLNPIQNGAILCRFVSCNRVSTMLALVRFGK